MKNHANKVRVANPDGHVIGLDIGATGVRAAVLAQHAGNGEPTVTVHGIGRVDLPDGVVVNGIVCEPEMLTAALKHLWQVNGFECRNVVLGTASHQVLVRNLTLPNLSAEQRAKALPFQAKEVIALPVDELVLDFCELSAPDPVTDTIDGLLVATPRQPILSAVAAVEKADLRVARVDLASFGVLRAMADPNLQAEAMIDFGAHLTTMIIHERGVPKLVRTLVRGSAELTTALADRMSMEPGVAEAAKRNGGLEHENSEIGRSLSETIRPLIAEIRTSIGYFRRSNEGAQIERVSLTGGGALLGGLTSLLQIQLGVPVVVVEPMQNVENGTSLDKVQTSDRSALPSAVSVGLAMGAAA